MVKPEGQCKLESCIPFLSIVCSWSSNLYSLPLKGLANKFILFKWVVKT